MPKYCNRSKQLYKILYVSCMLLNADFLLLLDESTKIAQRTHGIKRAQNLFFAKPHGHEIMPFVESTHFTVFSPNPI